MFDLLKTKMLEIYFEKRAATTKKPYYKVPLFFNGRPIDMNVAVFREISVSFLKIVVLRIFSK